MKDFYKNPIFYYMLIPILVALWPLSISLFYLPDTEKLAENEQSQHNEAKLLMNDILVIDPGRLDVNNDKENAKEFDYATAIGQIAASCKIPSTNYSIDSDQPRLISGRKTQSATVILQKVEIKDFALFLSSLLRRWANLECVSVDINKQKGLADSWKITLKFKYYY